MAEPRLRFKMDDGSSYPPLVSDIMGDYFTERNEPGDASLPFLTVSIHSGISDGELDEESLGKRVNRIADPAQNKKVEAGDLVFNMMRAWQGAVGCAKSAGMVSPAYIVAAPNSCIHPPYMDLYVKTKPIIDQFNRLSYGALDFRKRLYWDSFTNTRIFLPCLEEQIKIADFLSSIDEVISFSEQEVANLETQKKAVMKKIFSQEVRFKRSDGSDFPEWEDDTLGNHCTFFNGDRGKNYPSTSDYVAEGLPFINAGDLDGKHISEKCAKISEEKYNQLGGAKLARNDILYCLRGSLGKMGIVDFDTGGTVASSLVAIRAKDVDYLYMYYFLGSPLEYEQRKVNDEGLAQPNLSAKNVGGYVMPIPCLEEQRLIAVSLSDFDEAIAAAKKELELWKELKKGLLQQMFV